MVGVLNGHHRGFWLSAVQYLGLLVGVLLGAALAPVVTDRLGITSSIYRPLAAVLVLVIVTSLVTSVAHWLADPLRLKAEWRKERQTTPGFWAEFDRLTGAAFSGLAVLGVCWFLGLTFSQGPNQEIANQIQHSSIEHRLDAIVPQPPWFLVQVGVILRNTPFPPTWTPLEPLSDPLSIDASSAQTPAVAAAAAETFRITGSGCGGIVTGSGFPIATGTSAAGSNLVITNAHVVAGTTSTRVQIPGRPVPLPATVILFDPNRDLAVLRVDDLQATPLQMAPANRGTEGAIIGYPGGGDERVVPATVDGSWEADGQDIYGRKPVQRQIFIVEGDVVAGNSGGPLVDRAGHVLGVVFAVSTTRAHEAYVLTDQEVSAGVTGLKTSAPGIDTRAYACAI